MSVTACTNYQCHFAAGECVEWWCTVQASQALFDGQPPCLFSRSPDLTRAVLFQSTSNRTFVMRCCGIDHLISVMNNVKFRFPSLRGMTMHVLRRHFVRFIHFSTSRTYDWVAKATENNVHLNLQK